MVHIQVGAALPGLNRDVQLWHLPILGSLQTSEQCIWNKHTAVLMLLGRVLYHFQLTKGTLLLQGHGCIQGWHS